MPAVVTAACSVPFVLVVFWVSVGFSLPLAGAIVLGVVALSGVPLLFVRRWAVRGIGMGLLIGWAVMTILSAGICTGVNPVFYS